MSVDFLLLLDVVWIAGVGLIPISMFVCKLKFAFALEEGMWVHVHIIEKCWGFGCLCGE